VWGIRREADRQLAAYANGVFISADTETDLLPDAGWRFAIESAFAPAAPNCLCLLVANVDPRLHGLGLAVSLLEAGKEVARQSGLKTIIAPVRPMQKDAFSSLSMADYVLKRTETGEIFDPWLRAHVRLGGEVLNVCTESVVVRASLGRWRKWTGRTLTESGAVNLPGGLAPILVDVENEIGTYIEPNVWVRYRLD
jgi:hypothetical protein